MKLRILLGSALALALALPATAAVTTYNLDGDQSTLFPTDGTILRPDTVYGTAVIDDDGTSSPTLVSMDVVNQYTDVVGATSTTGVPGSTVSLASRVTFGPSGGQTGTGDTGTMTGTGGAVAWGTLTGWSQTGTLTCITSCFPGCSSSCVLFGVTEGVGPPAPLNATAYDLGPWTFAADGSTFSDPDSTEYVTLGSGAVTGDLIWDGLEVTIPMLPIAAFGGLGVGLVYLGSRALRRKED